MQRDTEPICILRGHQTSVTSVRFCDTGGVLVSGDASGRVLLWDTTGTRRKTADFVACAGSAVLLAQPCGGSVFVQAKDGSVSVFDVGAMERTQRFETGAVTFGKMCVLDGGKTVLAPVAEESAVAMFVDGEAVRMYRPLERSGMVMAVQRIGESVCVLYESGSAVFFDAGSGNVQGSFRATKETAVCMDVFEDRMVVGSAGDAVEILRFDPATFAPVGKPVSLGLPKPGLNEVTVRSDGKLFLTAGWDARLRVFALHKPRPLAILKCHTSGVSSASFNPENPSYFASGSEDNRIALWKLY